MTVIPPKSDELIFWELVRQSILGVLHAIEVYKLHYKTTTSQIRKWYKETRKELL